MNLYIKFFIFILINTAAQAVITIGGDNTFNVKDHSHAFKLTQRWDSGTSLGSGGFVEIPNLEGREPHIVGLTAKHCIADRARPVEVIAFKNNPAASRAVYIVEKVALVDDVFGLPPIMAQNKVIQGYLDQLPIDLGILFFSEETQREIRKNHNTLVLSKKQDNKIFPAEFAGYGRGGFFEDRIITPFNFPEDARAESRGTTVIGIPKHMTARLEVVKTDSTYPLWLWSQFNWMRFCLEIHEPSFKEGLAKINAIAKLSIEEVEDIANKTRQAHLDFIDSLPEPADIVCKNAGARKSLGKIILKLKALRHAITYLDGQKQLTSRLFTPRILSLVIDPADIRKTDGVIMPGDSGGLMFDPATRSAVGIANSGGFNVNEDEDIIPFSYDAQIQQRFTSLQNPHVLDWIVNTTKQILRPALGAAAEVKAAA